MGTPCAPVQVTGRTCRNDVEATVLGISRRHNEDTSATYRTIRESVQEEENEIEQTVERKFTVFRASYRGDDPRYVCRHESVNHAVERKQWVSRFGAFSERERERALAEERRIYNPNKITRRDFRGRRAGRWARERRRGSSFPTMKIHRCEETTTTTTTRLEEARRDVNVKHHRGTPQIEPTGFRCRVLEIRVSLASTFTILLFPAPTSQLLFSLPNNLLGAAYMRRLTMPD